LVTHLFISQVVLLTACIETHIIMESSDDEPLVNVKKRKKIKAKAKPDAAKSSSAKKRKREAPDPAVSSSSSKKPQGKELKKLEKSERLQYAMQAFLWWNAKEPPEGCQWDTMEHAGVSFPEEYLPHRVKMLYEGKPVDLTPLQEEA
jgi:DNA topoisomerase-1